MTSPFDPTVTNREHYLVDEVVAEYTASDRLNEPEKQIIANHADEFRGAVLDLGVGGGRTSSHLMATASTYVGLDFSPAMVEACRRRYPTGTFVRGDASDLHTFGDHTFDVGLFSFNGIDTVDHPTRLRILAEARRVLVPGGLFVFSFHSRDARGHIKALRLTTRPTLAWARTQMRNVASWWRVRGGQVETDEYALWSDPEAGPGCLTYFITKLDQFDQLIAAGFDEISMYDFNGRPVVVEAPDRRSFWFYVTCRPTSTSSS